jgi:hypothetical protein
MKMNVDAVISRNLRRASVVAIVRDHAGNFLGALGVVLDGITEPEIVEVMAYREGLAFGG